MTGRNFALKPFSPPDSPLPYTITGNLARDSHQLVIHYALCGPLAELEIPHPAAIAARKHGLWQETCFEFFLAARNSEGYWEFNLSPAGHWNVYHFTGYRRGMAEETAFTSLPLSIRRRSDSLLVALELEVANIVPADQTLEVAVAAVIRLRDSRLTYWALAHPGPQADFHRRDSFLLEL